MRQSQAHGTDSEQSRGKNNTHVCHTLRICCLATHHNTNKAIWACQLILRWPVCVYQLTALSWGTVHCKKTKGSRLPLALAGRMQQKYFTYTTLSATYTTHILLCLLHVLYILYSVFYLYYTYTTVFVTFTTHILLCYLYYTYNMYYIYYRYCTYATMPVIFTTHILLCILHVLHIYYYKCLVYLGKNIAEYYY